MNRVKLNSSRAKKGFTLTEIAIVLGIIGTILGAIWSAASHASQASKTTKMVNEIISMTTSMRAVYAGRMKMSGGCLNNAMITANVFPAEAIQPAIAADGACGQTAVLDPWGNQIDIASQEGWDTLPILPDAFEINVAGSLDNMPTSQCDSVLSQITSNKSMSKLGLIGIASGGVAKVTGSDAVAAIADGYFMTCSGHYVLQFTID